MSRRHPARRPLAFLGATVATAICALLALWATTPQWGAALLRQQLQKQHIQLDLITLQRPRWQRLDIERLVLTLPSGSHSLLLDGSNITIHYRWRQLLAGTVARADIAQLRLTLRPLTQPIPTPPSSHTAVPLPSELFTRLPLGEAHIADLRIDIPVLPAQLTGHLDFIDQSLALQLQSALPHPLELHLRADQHNQIDLKLRTTGRDVLTLANRLHRTDATNSTAITGELHADLDALQQLLQPETLRLAGTADAQWRGQIPGTLDDQLLQQLTLDGEIRTDFSIGTPGLPAVKGRFASPFKLADNHLSGAITQGEFQTRAPPPAALASLYKLKSGQLLPVELRIDDSTRFDIDFGKPANWSAIFSPIRVDARVQEHRAGLDASARLDALSLHYGPALAASAHLTALTPTLPLGDMRLQPARLDSTLSLAGAQLSGDWRLADVAGVYQLNGSAKYQLDAREGTLHAELQPLTFKEGGSYLPQLFKPWPWPLDLSSGGLKLQGDLRWSAAGVNANGSLQALAIGGFYDRNLFSGLNTTASIRVRDGKMNVAPTTVTIAEVLAGLPIRRLTVRLENTPESLLINDFSADLLGGNVSQQQIRYNWREREHHFALNLRHLQLDQILALQKGVEGTGTLDGTVPIEFGPAGIRVDGAQLQARPPGGVLRYDSGSPLTAATNPGLAIALKSLQNFHYDAMSVKADYAESGNLTLGVALQGRNPTALDTPPVNFNLNIHENIPDLLRTLQLGQDISDRIEQRLKTLRAKQQRSRTP